MGKRVVIIQGHPDTAPSGIGPIHANLFGLVEAVSAKRRAAWLAEARRLGARAA